MAQRKLQAEIDKTLKAVAVGVETFESTFEKLQHASSTTQKEKVETDLKTQIKKLQRIRDQIKSWISSSDIKDKTALIDGRKSIETQMERFKALEKEMKMKAFSKEGLIAQSKLDPAEKAKREIVDWIGNTVDELSRQIELTEAEAESLNTGKKKKGQGADRLGELETLNERRQWHIARLEVVQRMLENGQLQTDQVEAIQEDVKYFVEANTEEDFEEDEGIYDELNLVDEDDYTGDLHNDETSNLDSASVADTVDTAPLPLPKTPAKDDKDSGGGHKKTTPASRSLSMSQGTSGPSAVAALEDPPSPIAGKKQPVRKTTAETKPAATPEKAAVKTDASSKEIPAAAQPTGTTPVTKTLPPIRYAAAAAAAVASQIPAMPTVPAPVPSDSPRKEDAPTGSATANTTSIPPPPSSAEPPKDSSPFQSASAPPPPPGLSKSPAPLAPSNTVTSPVSTNGPAPPFAQAPAQTQQASAPPPPPGVSAPPGYPTAPQTQPGTASDPQTARAPASTAQGPPAQQPIQNQASGSRVTSPPSAGAPQGVMGNLMHSFDMAKESSERRSNDINELNAALDTSYLNAPHLEDSEPPRYYHPRTPIKTPSYYPQTRLPILEDKRSYQRMEIDQLFFVFYYMTGTYEQCVKTVTGGICADISVFFVFLPCLIFATPARWHPIALLRWCLLLPSLRSLRSACSLCSLRWAAAQELKRQSWRFHKQYLTWFQRAHNPQAVTSDYEQGGYFYFDWENSWCQRKKSDFRFEYRWLSDD
ncbi:Not1 N-terminal domain, CCR4-Not complex component-domain-containing protein [Kockovaella imperatae]|uniref:General negative regulator of transcription subunit n=1 Tax=Kockovaella imperatae TaxID=4999 RepID=A0A1Y1ULJ6_9TREE|nr:Not1 N-terminal domain, CCR4-Not complex component-domain-containing protein [Kockovaella imperatae]ORX38920.1 Not1 N-terminal domain, CCR4-Not complex component-domain-containing protein [Kockovaella imperatae]